MITVVKIGGNVIDSPEGLEQFLIDFAALEGKKILVHGGGKIATRIGERLGLKTTMINGRRVTDKDTLNLVTMVYAGLVNKDVVARLLPLGCDAIGMCGADGGLIYSRRRSPEPVDFGEVGDVESVNLDTLRTLLDGDLTPVVCAITTDGLGHILNTNADSVASAMALGATPLDEVKLIYCFEKPGVLLDVENDDSVIPLINHDKFHELKEGGNVHQGMLPKLENALQAVDAGVKEVWIKSAASLAIPDAGTKICNDEL